MLKPLMKNMTKKLMWLSLGFGVGIGISSTFADSRAPASYQFKVIAVSAEDAAEKASDMLRGGELTGAFETTGLIAAATPTCEEAGNTYSCKTRLFYLE